MDFTKDIKCINCGEIMKDGNMWVSTDAGIFRYCDCGIHMIIYSPNKNYDYGLHRKLKKEID